MPTSLTAPVLSTGSITEGGRSVSSELLALLLGASSGAASLLLHGGRDNLGREREVGPKVVKASLGTILVLSDEVAVVVLPGEGNADEALAAQGLHEHHNLKVGHTLDLRVGRKGGVLLHNANSLLEEVGVDSDTVGLRDEHDAL